MVDGQVLSANQRTRRQPQGAVSDGDAGVGRDHIDVVGFDHGAVGDFRDWNLGCPRKDFPQFTGMFWIQVLHQHKRHASFLGQLTQQLRERFQASSGSPDADHRKHRGMTSARCLR